MSMPNKNFKIGIYGSAADISTSSIDKAIELGDALSKLNNLILVTGACEGLPYQVVSEAHTKKNSMEIVEFSHCLNLDDQKKSTPNTNLKIYSKINYVPPEFPYNNLINAQRKYRNVTSTAFCDAGIIISGRWGTLNEFTNLYDMGKVIGVLTGTGGVADELQILSQKITKKSEAVVLYNDKPDELVQNIIEKLQERDL